METPPGLAGTIVEGIMAEWRRQNPDADTARYNRAYTETLRIVEDRLAVEQFKGTVQPSPVRFFTNAAGVILNGGGLLETLAKR